MRFALNDEQQALSEATRDYFSSHVNSDFIRSAMVSESGFNESFFASLCTELGLSSLVIPEKYGGFGASDIELAVALEHHGHFLVPTPLRIHASSAFALLECGTEEAKVQYLPLIARGEALSYVDYRSESAKDVVVSSGDSIDSYSISGEFIRLPFGMNLNFLFFIAEINGINSLFVVDLSQDSINRNAIASIDQTLPLANIEMKNANAELISNVRTDIKQPFIRAENRAVIAASNEMVGSAQAALDMSVTYAKDRIQFGRPIGSFQAIKHKCADMLLEVESSRSIAMYGSWLASQAADFVSEDLEDDLNHIASMVKYYVSKTFSHVSGENIQIHGGIGFTFEHDAHLYFKRAAFMAVHLGDAHEHSKELAYKISRTT